MNRDAVDLTEKGIPTSKVINQGAQKASPQSFTDSDMPGVDEEIPVLVVPTSANTPSSIPPQIVFKSHIQQAIKIVEKIIATQNSLSAGLDAPSAAPSSIFPTLSSLTSIITGCSKYVQSGGCISGSFDLLWKLLDLTSQAALWRFKPYMNQEKRRLRSSKAKTAVHGKYVDPTTKKPNTASSTTLCKLCDFPVDMCEEDMFGLPNLHPFGIDLEKDYGINSAGLTEGGGTESLPKDKGSIIEDMDAENEKRSILHDLEWGLVLSAGARSASIAMLMLTKTVLEIESSNLPELFECVANDLIHSTISLVFRILSLAQHGPFGEESGFGETGSKLLQQAKHLQESTLNISASETRFTTLSQAVIYAMYAKLVPIRGFIREYLSNWFLICGHYVPISSNLVPNLYSGNNVRHNAPNNSAGMGAGAIMAQAKQNAHNANPNVNVNANPNVNINATNAQIGTPQSTISPSQIQAALKAGGVAAAAQLMSHVALSNIYSSSTCINCYKALNQLLSLLQAILQGIKESKDQEAKSMVKHWIPLIVDLHSPDRQLDEFVPLVSSYHKQLCHCIRTMIEIDPQNGARVIDGVIKLWPSLNSKLGCVLLNGLEDAIERLENDDFKAVAYPLAVLLGRHCIGGDNFILSQRALQMLSNDNILNHCVREKDRVFPVLIPPILRTAESHWSNTTNQLALKALILFARHDETNSLARSQTFINLSNNHNRLVQLHDTELAKQKLRESEKKGDLNFGRFAFGHVLGEGSYSKVRYAKLIGSHSEQRFWDEYAIKIMDLGHLKQQNYHQQALVELNLLAHLDHPHVIKCVGHFEDRGSLYIVQEYCEKGDVFALLSKFGSLDENYVKFLISEIVLALEYLHLGVDSDFGRKAGGILFGDLKPENVLLSRDGHVRLTDFGSAIVGVQYTPGLPSMASAIDEKDPLPGTAEYISPELIKTRKPSLSSDIWALGVLMYQLLVGKIPFYVDSTTTSNNNDANVNNHNKLFDLISSLKEGDLVFPENVKISEPAKDLILKLLAPDCEIRPMVSQIKEHEFFKDVNFDEISVNASPNPVAGSVKKEEIDFKLRQRRYSMMVTKAIKTTFNFDDHLPAIKFIKNEDLNIWKNQFNRKNSEDNDNDNMDVSENDNNNNNNNFNGHTNNSNVSLNEL